MGDTRIDGVPDCGYAVLRRRLIDAFQRTTPDVTVVVAPGGYGKTVFAAQLVRAVGGDCLWVAMGGCSPTDGDFPSAVAAGLRLRAARGFGSDHLALCSGSESGWERLQLELGSLPTAPSLVVLDGLDSLQSTASLLGLLQLLRDTGLDRPRVVCTCRDVHEGRATPTHDASCWTVTRSELEFATEQTRDLATHILLTDVAESDAEALTLSSGGQPALLVLLLRHAMCHDISISEALRQAPKDVGDYLRSEFMTPSGAGALRALGTAALLGSGSIGDLARVAGLSSADVLAAARVVPLLRLKSDAVGVRTFEMHELASEVFGSVLLERTSDDDRCAIDAVIRELECRGEYHRLFGILIRMDDSQYLVSHVERLGSRLLEDACFDLLESLLLQIPVAVQAGSVRLLLLGAMLLRLKGRVPEALERAASARRLAAASSDALLERDCLIVEARLRIDACQFDILVQPLSRACEAALKVGDYDTAALLSAYLATSHAQLGDVAAGREYVEQYKRLYQRTGVRAATRAQSVSMILLVLGIICGDVASAAVVLKDVRGDSGQPLESRLLCEGNLAALLLEMGRVRDSLQISRAAQAQAQRSGFSYLIDSFAGTDAAACAGCGDLSGAESLMGAAIEHAICPDDTSNIACNRMYRSTIRRASGLVDEALADAEQALVVFSRESGRLPTMACLARCEVAASMLSLGDLQRAYQLAAESCSEASMWTAAYHLLRADMVLAEIERQQGAVDDAVARIAQHREYILTESANWQIAMYIRAFPGLLGVFGKAVGTDALPSHLLRMVLHDYARPALEACHDILTSADIERLATRLLGKRAAAVFMRERANGPKATVRLFGGMQVVTPFGTVTDKDWRKRKARLLFALLVLRRGQDMPREQVFEHFWPEMDEERAKSNFYVTWSIMKRALAVGTSGKDPCPYVEHVGGVCRVVPALIASDFAEFEDALTAMRKADRAGDAALALAAAERIVEQYRGELLPGELYDDWLGPIRDRCRQDYGDAMLRASQLTYEAGDTEKALHLVRAGLGQDPWREDLYQAALRYLIHTGQRSGAIETYVACKSKLAEDLGLDPSTETQRLYDQILAMEDPPGAPARG